MPDLSAALRGAITLIGQRDGELLQIAGLSLFVSFSATAIAAVIGLPLGAALAMLRFRGRSAIVLGANALLGLPPIVVGLALYLVLSRVGPLGTLDLLFTPAAMVLAQTLLAIPIVTALAHRGLDAIWSEVGPAFQIDGARTWQAMPHLLAIGRAQVLTAVLAGFGRAISEVGAIIIVGGNIAGHTRTMTTAIALETSEGNLGFAMALGLLLVALSVTVSLFAFAVAVAGEWRIVHHGRKS